MQLATCTTKAGGAKRVGERDLQRQVLRGGDGVGLI